MTMKMTKTSTELTFDQTIQFQSVMAHLDRETMTIKGIEDDTDDQ